MPDITLLPALANLYNVTLDALVGMDKINNVQTRNAVFTKARNYWKNGELNAAIEVFVEALKTFPNDEGIMSDLAMALALDGDAEKLSRAVSLCERVLSGGQGEKVHHTTRAALCFIYLKSGEKEKAAAVARKLPHVRESREMILTQIEKNMSADEIDSYLKFIAIGDSDEQDIVTVDFGLGMVSICEEHDILGRIGALRNEIGAPSTSEGFRILPRIRIRDNNKLSSNQARLRNYADYTLDKEYDNPADAVDDIIAALRNIALANAAQKRTDLGSPPNVLNTAVASFK